MANYTELTEAAETVRDETLQAANTAARVGGAMVDAVALMAATAGVVDAGAVTGTASFASLQLALDALQQSGFPADAIGRGKMLVFRDELMGRSRLVRYGSGDKWDAAAWEECYVDRYSPVVGWSGETVEGVDVVAGSLMSGEGAVVYDTAKGSFLFRLDGDTPKYYGNWPSRSQFQDNVYVSGGTFTAAFTAAVFLGDDGSVWLPSSASMLVRVVAPAAVDEGAGLAVFAGVFASVADDIVEAEPGDGARLWYVKALRSFAWGVVTRSSAAWDGSGGVARFTFTGKTSFELLDTVLHPEWTLGGRLLADALGRLVPSDAGVMQLSVDGTGLRFAAYSHVRGAAGQNANTGAECVPLFSLAAGDYLLADGTFCPASDYLGCSDAVGIIVDPAKGLFLPVPLETEDGAFYAASAGVKAINAVKDTLAMAAGCVEADAVLDNMRWALGGADTSYEAYFPAFYAARWGDSARMSGYRRLLATRAECEAMTDGAVRDALVSWYHYNAEAGDLPTAFYGTTPRYSMGDAASLAYVTLQGSDGMTVPVAQAPAGGFPLLALYPR